MKSRKVLFALVLALVLCLCAGVAFAWNPSEGDYNINNLADLKAFRDAVDGGNAFGGKTVVLKNDIDLNNEEWNPIGSSSVSFNGTFDGGNHTISNLMITGNKSNVGLFAFTQSGEIKNLTLHNAQVSGRLQVGALAGTPYTSKYTNIKLTGHVEVNGFSYVGGLLGKNLYANATDITINVDSSSYVRAVSTENGTSYRTYVGGLVGFMGEGSHTVKNVTSNIAVYGDVCDIGGIAGIGHYGNNFVNCSVSSKIVYEGTDPENAAEIGGIVGVWHNESGYTVTLEDCEYKGTFVNLPEGTEITNGGLTGTSYNNSGSGSLKKDDEVLNKDTTPVVKTGTPEAEELLGDKVVSSAEVFKFEYLNGDTFLTNVPCDLIFRSPFPFDPDLSAVKLVNANGANVEKKTYIKVGQVDGITIEKGSIKVTLDEKYLSKLANGTYTISIVPNTNDGHENENVLSGTFTVAENTFKGRTPQTGDNSNLALWIALMVISAISFMALGRKSRFN